MAKSVNIGVTQGVAPNKVKAIYIGTSEGTKKIKKAWIGVDGVPRLVFSGGTPVLVRVDSSINRSLVTSSNDYVSGSTSIGNYAIFAGNVWSGSSNPNAVTVNSSLTASTVALSRQRWYLRAASLSNYALIGNGTSSGDNRTYTLIDAFNSSLTRTIPTALSDPRYATEAISFNNYVLFAGGIYGGTLSSTIDVYNSSLSRSSTTGLSVARQMTTGVKAGNYVLFCGGRNDSYGGFNTIDIYNTSLTRSNVSSLTTSSTAWAAGTSLGTYGLVGAEGNEIEVFNGSLTKSKIKKSTYINIELGATTLNDFAIFAGGYNYSGEYLKTVNIINSSLTLTTGPDLKTAARGGTATTLGDYALFGCGKSSSPIEVYTIEYK